MNQHTLIKAGFESFDNDPPFGTMTDALKPVLEAEAHNDLLPRLTQRWTGTRPVPRIWSLDDFTSPIVLPCIEPYLAQRGWKTHGVTGADQASPEHETSPFDPPYQRLPTNALYFVEDTKLKTRLIVASNEGGTRYTQVVFDGQGADEALAGFKDFVQAHNPLRGRSFDLDGKLLELPRQPPPPVVLTDEQRRCVDRHILLPVQKAANLAKLGSRPSRGVLLEGPPGLGKSHLIKTLIPQLDQASVLLATPKQLGGFEAVEHLRQLIRWTTPGLVVILEELDLIGTDRSLGLSPNLGDLLQVLDGIQSRNNNGVIWIATTNRPEVLEEALARPGRFDRRIKFGPLPQKTLGELIDVLSQPCGLTAEAAGYLRDKIKGFTGAQVREVLETARLIHVERERADDVPLDADSIEGALQDCGFKGEEKIGFH